MHRDIKPSNVLIRPNGTPVLTDLGIAMMQYNPRLTQTDRMIGTPDYMSPEHAKGDSLDGRSDIYSLGVMLYEMLAGQRPFVSDQPWTIIHKHINEAPPPLKQFRPNLSSQTLAAVDKCLQKEPTQRYQNAESLIRDIDRALLAEGATGEETASGVWLWQRPNTSDLYTAQKQRRKLPLWAALLLAVVVIGGIVGILAWRSRSADTASKPVTTALPVSATEVVAAATDTPAPTSTVADSDTITPIPFDVLAARAGRGGGVPLSFETTTPWERGGNANGEWSEESDPALVHDGEFSARLAYSFTSDENEFVTFAQYNLIENMPEALQIWVYGDNSGHYLNGLIMDDRDQLWEIDFGRIFHEGWQPMTASLESDSVKPLAESPTNRIIYPIRFFGFTLDDYADHFQGTGTIYLDALAVVESVAEVTPTASNVATATPRTPTPRATPSSTPKPTPTATSSNPTGSATTGGGLPLGFENFGTWSRGDEANGTFEQSRERAFSGGTSGKLSYQFESEDNDYVVFMQFNTVPEDANEISAQVYGDGSGHFLNAWIIDAEGETWQTPLGQITHTGWKQMIGYIVPGQNWPWTHISGPDNDVVDYPIRFRGIVLDDYTDSYTGSGVIFVDDVTARYTESPGEFGGPIVVTPPSGTVMPTPTGTSSTPQAGSTNTPALSPTPTPSPTPTLSPDELGRIIYTSNQTLMMSDPTWESPRELGVAASNSCSTPATTVAGLSFDLYFGYSCNVSESISTCRSPNGLQEIVIDGRAGGGEVTLVVYPVGSDPVDGFPIFTGVIDVDERIRWSPLSDSFLFVIGDSINRAFTTGGYREVIPIGYEPIISPDGSQILYRQPIGPGVNDVFVANIDGSDRRNVTNVLTTDKRCAAWVRP